MPDISFLFFFVTERSIEGNCCSISLKNDASCSSLVLPNTLGEMNLPYRKICDSPREVSSLAESGRGISQYFRHNQLILSNLLIWRSPVRNEWWRSIHSPGLPVRRGCHIHLPPRPSFDVSERRIKTPRAG